MIRTIFVAGLALSFASAMAQELVVLECSTDGGKWWGTLEIDIKAATIKFDNVFARFVSDQWNDLLKTHAKNNGTEYRASEYKVPEYKVTSSSKSEIRAQNPTSGEIVVNRYTRVLRDRNEEFKCERREKAF